MKKSVLTLFLLALIAFGSDGQTIRRCNNNPGVTGVNMYTTIQAAHDAAVAGDIIYLEPSSVSYGNLDARKRLTIIGNGYFWIKILTFLLILANRKLAQLHSIMALQIAY